MTDEILKDEELEQVVGGSGIECIGFLSRLKAEGSYTPKTPLTQGNEAAAAKELQSFLLSVKDHRNGTSPFAFCKLYYDGRPNDYGIHSARASDSPPLTDVEDAFQILKGTLGK